MKVYAKKTNCAEYLNSIENDEDVSFLSEYGLHNVNLKCMATKSTTVDLNPEFQSRNFTYSVRYEEPRVLFRCQSEQNLSYLNDLHSWANRGTQRKRRITWTGF